MFPSPRIECASVEQTIFTPASTACLHVDVAQVEPVRQAVHLQRHSLLERDLDQAIDVELVLGPAVDVPALRVRETGDVRVAQRLLDPLRLVALRQALAAVDARLHPIQLGEDGFGQVEPAVREDVALGATEDAEGRERIVDVGDLERLAAEVVRRESTHGADGRRVVADRQVLVAALDRGKRHLLDARPPVRPGGMRVQVAADLRELDQRRRLVAKRLLAKLRRAERNPERAVDALLVACVRQRLERRHVLGRAGRTDQLRAEPGRLGDHELDRDALDRDPVATPFGTLQHGNDRRQRSERIQHRRRFVRRGDDREPLAGVAVAARIAGRGAAERLGDLGQQPACAVDQHPARRARIVGPRQSGEQLRLVGRADSGYLAKPARGRRLP